MATTRNAISSPAKEVELAFRKRSDVVAEEIKGWVIEHNLAPGDRLPPERELMEIFSVSKSTIREALKALEVQGLIRVTMGPGGGGVLVKVDEERAMSLLAPYFYFGSPTIADIYQVRIVLEPEMAASAMGHLSGGQMAELKQLVEVPDRDSDDPEERHRRRLAELRFHEVIADACPNSWLAFACKFMLRLLRHIVVVGRIYEFPMREMSHANHCCHVDILKAIEAGDREGVRRLMEHHMKETAEHMTKIQGRLDRRRFLRPS